MKPVKLAAVLLAAAMAVGTSAAAQEHYPSRIVMLVFSAMGSMGLTLGLGPV
jgi:hypothetical protein